MLRIKSPFLPLFLPQVKKIKANPSLKRYVNICEFYCRGCRVCEVALSGFIINQYISILFPIVIVFMNFIRWDSEVRRA